MRQRRILLACVMCAAFILSLGVSVWPALSLVFLFIAGGALLALLWDAGKTLLGRRRYDLGMLQQVHEREEIRRLEESLPEVPEDEVFCLCCMSAYPATFPTCPECGKPGKKS